MYSMVLMMALTSGAEAPAFGHSYVSESCCGGCCSSSCCGGTVVYSTCCGGGCSSSCCGYSSCCGGGHKLFSGFGGWFKHHSCCGGCCGYSSCCGGCCGGTVITSGCCGGCCGGTVVAPAAPAAPAPTKVMEEPKKEDMKKDEPKKDVLPEPKKEARNTVAPATILVSLPADAKLLIDDAATASTSASRRFVTPELEVGKVFTYTLKATVVRDGKTVVASKVVTVRAGETSNIEIEVPTVSVAAK
jgi:uncharacterized protein (TIGR03000 family)